ncbi:MAG: hypothetical protein BRD45_03295 [Bacteroidetes bacterium QS_8_64_10]|nr:MAG: hypothetical protein BRD45_03295 [Bacteroidetes bacterium QS_8_64_10]
MKRLSLVFLLILALPACSLLELGDGSDGNVTLVNRSGEPIYYHGLELESSHLVDPMTSFDPDDSPFPRLDDGASVTLTPDEIEAYKPGDGVRFLAYALRPPRQEEEPPPDAEKVASLVAFPTATGEELRRNDGRVVVRDLGVE